jgi:hypothetical protein
MVYTNSVIVHTIVWMIVNWNLGWRFLTQKVVGRNLNLKMVVALIWNLRGLNRPDKLTRVHDLIRETCPDIISFSESKKKDFSVIQLKQLDPYEKFTWNWLPTKDTAGGILVGINSDMFEVLRCDTFDYIISTLLKVKKVM